jgi:hypothetical protein
MGSCPLDLEIDIGDYEYHWKEWNRQNMIDYQIGVFHFNSNGGGGDAVIIVKNGVPESSDPSEWLAIGKKSTIPDFFSFI